ncbi:MAG: hypothetical protein ACODAD_16540, partial [Planctomycetota bacterium]
MSCTDGGFFIRPLDVGGPWLAAQRHIPLACGNGYCVDAGLAPRHRRGSSAAEDALAMSPGTRVAGN